MDQKILEMLTKMHQEMQEGFKGVNTRLDKIEAKIEGIGGQFELLSSYKIELSENVNEEIEFIADKVTRLEKDIFRMKHKQ
jgi:DNA-binding protein H-NS